MPPPTSVRELDDDSIALLLQAYIDRAGAGDPLVLLSAPLTALCAAVYGPGRCRHDGDADADRRVWRHVCAKLGLAALPAYAGGPTTWKATFAALRAEVMQLSADDRDDFRRAVRRKPYSAEVLFKASLGGHVLVVAAILSRVPATDVDARCSRGVTSMMLASACGRLTVVEWLLAAGAEVDAREENCRTALIGASMYNHPAVVETLLAAGADREAHDESGWRALMLAGWNGQLEAVRALLAAGVDVRACDNLGFTVLMHASYRGNLAVVEALLTHGADINAVTPRGSTALSSASRGGHIDTIQVLLAAGANVNTRHNDGRTALMLATDGGHAHVARALLAVDGVVVDPGQRDRILEVLRKADETLVDEAIRKAGA